MTVLCHRCGSPWVSEQKRPGFKEICAGCGAYLHCCKNCRFYDPSAHNQCRIGTTEWVADRERANFCEEFEWAENGKNIAKSDTGKARSGFEQLFGGTLGDTGEKRPRDFEGLFGD